MLDGLVVALEVREIETDLQAGEARARRSFIDLPVKRDRGFSLLLPLGHMGKLHQNRIIVRVERLRVTQIEAHEGIAACVGEFRRDIEQDFAGTIGRRDDDRIDCLARLEPPPQFRDKRDAAAGRLGLFEHFEGLFRVAAARKQRRIGFRDAAEGVRRHGAPCKGADQGLERFGGLIPAACLGQKQRAMIALEKVVPGRSLQAIQTRKSRLRAFTSGHRPGGHYPGDQPVEIRLESQPQPSLRGGIVLLLEGIHR